LSFATLFEPIGEILTLEYFSGFVGEFTFFWPKLTGKVKKQGFWQQQHTPPKIHNFY